MLSKKAVNTEIKNLEVLDKMRLYDINYRHIMLVKYKGYNIAAQTIIPG